MVNYEIDPEVLRPHVPAGTELDSWQGKTFVSMVGFLFLDTRVMGIPALGYRDFEEVNLRFYVRREVDGELRRGVVFIKEIVPRRLLAWIARTVYNENYVAMPMGHDDQLGEASQALSYRWRHQDRWAHLRAQSDGDLYLPPDGSEASFIAEHYWGYVSQRDGSTLEYEVEHPPWRVWRARGAELVCDAATLYGADLAPYLNVSPSSAFIAEGSDIVVRRGRRLAAAAARKTSPP